MKDELTNTNVTSTTIDKGLIIIIIKNNNQRADKISNRQIILIMKREITTRGGRGRTNIDNMSCALEFTLTQYLLWKHERVQL